MFCGIARPERFFLLLEAEGIKPHFFLKFSDHHPYSPPSLKKIAEKSKKLHAEALITTEKDAVKIYDSQDFLKIPVYYQKVDLEVEEKFYEKILTFLKI
ncbi:Tetraacyldisaccharide 4'-kinase [subsurface metagenome]